MGTEGGEARRDVFPFDPGVKIIYSSGQNGKRYGGIHEMGMPWASTSLADNQPPMKEKTADESLRYCICRSFGYGRNYPF